MTDLTQERLKELLDYDPATGIFTWRVKPSVGVLVGARAGNRTVNGYHKIKIDYGFHLAHRLAWLLVYGKWPSLIDHINGNRSDNRIANLRLATRSQNCANRGKQRHNTSGFKGVHWDRRRKKWIASIGINNRKVNLGGYSSPEDAHAAHIRAARHHFGEFAHS